jgi:hypothetical protein
MGMQLDELEKRIERKISDLEREKSRLKDDLKVIRQASVIASEFEGAYGDSEWGQPEEYEESQAHETH